MRAQVKSKMNALIAAIMAVIFAFSLSGVPASALAADGDNSTGAAPTVHGIDFMQPTADGMEVVKVIGDQPVYIQVFKTEGDKKQPLSLPQKYPSDTSSNTPETSDTGSPVAQIIQIFIEGQVGEGETSSKAIDLIGKGVTYNVVVTTAMKGGEELYNGTIYPIYADLKDADGKSVGKEMLGIRTYDSRVDVANKNINVGKNYYINDTLYNLQPTESGLDNDPVDNAYVVTYVETSATAIQGSIKYVDAYTGEVVDEETVEGIEKDKPATVPVKKSFSKVTEINGQEQVQSYRVISDFTGTTKELTYANPSYTLQVVPLDINTTYPVTINYRDLKGNLLWSDDLDIRGEGYRYTLPNMFSISNDRSSSELKGVAEGVNLYTLQAVQGGVVSNAGDITTAESTGWTVPEEFESNAPLAGASDGQGTILNLTPDLIEDNFYIDQKGHRVINAYYANQDVDKKVTFQVVEMNGETNEEIGRVKATITPDEVTLSEESTLTEESEQIKIDGNTFAYTPGDKDVDGKTYIPWYGTTPIECSWDSLKDGINLVEYVYYVPEGYTPSQPKEVTLQYVNIANGSVLYSETRSISPDNRDYEEFSGPESFTQDGEEYVRLAGQENPIRHAYFSPNETYTIYYRNVNDTINANTVINRVEVIETTRPTAVTGGGLTAEPTPVDDAAAGEPAVDAGVGAGDGTVIINDDDNPLANLDGQSTTEERTIAENENPLASGIWQNGFVIAGIAAGVIALIGLAVYFLLRRRNKANDKQSA